MSLPIIGFAGMSHLGINTAVATAERGFNTLCYDPDTLLINNLQKQKLSVVEPGLSTLFSNNISSNRLKFTNDINHLSKCDVVYISSDVLTNEDGVSDLVTLQALIDDVCGNINSKASLVILSQVSPGFTRKLKEIHQSRLYYQVETLIFGKAIERAMYPERFIIGCDDEKKELNPLYLKLLKAFGCPILTMSYESAELTKISINCYLVANVTVSNVLSELSEKIGANWAHVIPALKLDKRIGQHSYVKPGLGFAGGNLERDMATILQLSEEQGTESNVVKSFIYNNHYRKDWILRILHQKIFSNHPNPLIAVLGLTYKENTNSMKNSAAIALLKYLKTYNIQAYDPTVQASILPWVIHKQSMDEVVKDAEVLVIMTPWEEFRSLTPHALRKHMRGKIIIDPYCVLDDDLFLKEGFQYFALGRGVSC